MSANNSPLKGVLGSKWSNVGKVEDKQDAAAAAQRRRSSASASKFPGLMDQKRGSTDAANYTDQKSPPGFLGGLWQRYEFIISTENQSDAEFRLQFHQRGGEVSTEYCRCPWFEQGVELIREQGFHTVLLILQPHTKLPD
ncbi:MAG: hypothetical protein Q9167_002560 [Letrouitia subvulpina]